MAANYKNMKKILLSAAVLAVVFTGCKKDDDNGGGTATNQWKIAGTTYTAVSNGVNSLLGTLIGAGMNGSTGSSFSIGFNGLTTPTTGGTYKIVSADNLDADDEISVSASVGSGTGTAYQSTGNDNMTAAVTVNGGKVSVTVPEIWAKNMDGNDSVKVSGNLTQP